MQIHFSDTALISAWPLPDGHSRIRFRVTVPEIPKVAPPRPEPTNGEFTAAFDSGSAYNVGVHLSIEIDREDDGRWIAEALELPGVMTYGQTREEAISNTEKLAIEVIADRIKHAELPPSALNVSFQVLSEQLAGD
jgi:predicted RNase H-like HicB family nuclease